MLDDVTSLHTLVPDVMRAAVVFDKSIPASMALSDLVRSAAEFARRALVLTDEYTIPVQHGEPDYLLPCVANTKIHQIVEVRRGCRQLHGLASGYARPGHHAHHWRHDCRSGYYFEPITNTIHLSSDEHHVHHHNSHYGHHGTGHDYQPEYPWQMYHHLQHHHANGEQHVEHNLYHYHGDHGLGGAYGHGDGYDFHGEGGHNLWLRVVLVPNGESDAVPSALLDNGEWRDAIIAGAIATMAELHAPARAAYWREKFATAITRVVTMRVTNYSSTHQSRMAMTGRRFIRR